MLVDDEAQFERIQGFLRRTSPEMGDRVRHWTEDEPLFVAKGVEASLRSTMDRRAPLPSGGYLVIDDTEAMTVIDVNSGRNVGKGGNRLEDTITKTNLEAAVEVVRQLRLRDIGGIIIIDFIDMDDERNRRAVKAALDEALAKDRTRTYVVNISPLGLVEMTRQNISDGPREIMTEICPTCAGVGVIPSDETHAIAIERELRQALKGRAADRVTVAVNPRIAEVMSGEEGDRLQGLEEDAGIGIDLQPDASLSPHAMRIRTPEEPGAGAGGPAPPAAAAARRDRLREAAGPSPSPRGVPGAAHAAGGVARRRATAPVPRATRCPPRSFRSVTSGARTASSSSRTEGRLVNKWLHDLEVYDRHLAAVAAACRRPAPRRRLAAGDRALPGRVLGAVARIASAATPGSPAWASIFGAPGSTASTRPCGSRSPGRDTRSIHLRRHWSAAHRSAVAGRRRRRAASHRHAPPAHWLRIRDAWVAPLARRATCPGLRHRRRTVPRRLGAVRAEGCARLGRATLSSMVASVPCRALDAPCAEPVDSRPDLAPREGPCDFAAACIRQHGGAVE